MSYRNSFAAFVFVFSLTSLVYAAPFDAGCRIEIDVNELNVPLIWNEKGIIYPSYNVTEDKWFLRFSTGEKFHASCSNDGDPETHFRNTQETQLELQCTSGSLLVRSAEVISSFERLYCTKALQASVVRNGTCYNGYTSVQVQFLAGNPPYTLLTACHNELIDETIFSQHQLFGEQLNIQEPVGNRPSFQEAGFYPTIDADNCYKAPQETETVAQLLGSRQLAQQYIQASMNLFMARGHFAPSGDPIYSFEKKSTFYFINASPQWQTINGGNFNLLEIATRNLANSLKATFTIWTGSFGNMKLNDVNNNPTEIWLGKDTNGTRRLPVAHLTWKVIHNQKHNSAIAVIQINNPWLISVSPEDIICPDVCGDVSWVNWTTTDIRNGYTYCCDVASFKQAVPYAPDLGNLPLLDY